MFVSKGVRSPFKKAVSSPHKTTRFAAATLPFSVDCVRRVEQNS